MGILFSAWGKRVRVCSRSRHFDMGDGTYAADCKSHNDEIIYGVVESFQIFLWFKALKVNSELNTVLALKLPIMELLSRNAHILSLGNLSKGIF